MWYVYLLLCNQKIFYVGITNNIKERLKNHKSRKSLFTLRFSDIKLVYCENYLSKFEASKREKQFKGWSHGKKQMLINGKLGRNQCAELVESYQSDEGLVSLP